MTMSPTSPSRIADLGTGMFDLSDEGLMAEIAAGDRAALEMLMARHLLPVVRLAGRILPDREDAHELGREVFLRLWRRAPAFRPGPLGFRPWLYRLVTEAAAVRLRLARLDAPGSVANMAIPDTAGLGAALADPMAAPVGALLAAPVAALVGALADRQRLALALHHFEDCTEDEAAEVLGLAPRAFGKLLCRARRGLLGKWRGAGIGQDGPCGLKKLAGWIERHGGRPERWPAVEAERAEELAAASLGARLMLKRALAVEHQLEAERAIPDDWLLARSSQRVLVELWRPEASRRTPPAVAVWSMLRRTWPVLALVAGGVMVGLASGLLVPAALAG